jgi:hypothetical protein
MASKRACESCSTAAISGVKVLAQRYAGALRSTVEPPLHLSKRCKELRAVGLALRKVLRPPGRRDLRLQRSGHVATDPRYRVGQVGRAGSGEESAVRVDGHRPDPAAPADPLLPDRAWPSPIDQRRRPASRGAPLGRHRRRLALSDHLRSITTPRQGTMRDRDLPRMALSTVTTFAYSSGTSVGAAAMCCLARARSGARVAAGSRYPARSEPARDRRRRRRALPLRTR